MKKFSCHILFTERNDPQIGHYLFMSTHNCSLIYYKRCDYKTCSRFIDITLHSYCVAFKRLVNFGFY